MQIVPIELLRAAEEWEREAANQRRISPALNPVADTLVFCATDLRERARQAEEARRDLSTAEYARAHGCAPGTVRKWCARGVLPGAVRGADGDWHIPAMARPVRPRTPTRTPARARKIA